MINWRYCCIIIPAAQQLNLPALGAQQVRSNGGNNARLRLQLEVRASRLGRAFRARRSRCVLFVFPNRSSFFCYYGIVLYLLISECRSYALGVRPDFGARAKYRRWLDQDFFAACGPLRKMLSITSTTTHDEWQSKIRFSGVKCCEAAHQQITAFDCGAQLRYYCYPIK